MTHIKKFEGNDIKKSFKNFFRSKKDIEAEKQIEELKKSLEEAKRKAAADKIESDRIKLEKEHQKSLQQLREINQKKQEEVEKKREEFLKEWKEICLEISDCLYDLKDFCDSSTFKDITNNEFNCYFYIPTGFSDDSFNINSSTFPNVHKIFEYLNIIRNDIRRIDKNILLESKFKNDGFSLHFKKPVDKIFDPTPSFLQRPRAPRR